MENIRVTIVCCYNNKNQYENELLASLKNQTEKYDIIIINNTKNNQFCSASKALNSVLTQIKTKFVIFSHQDIILTEKWELSKFVDYMEFGNIGDIYGVAGTSVEKTGILTAIYHGKDSHPAWERKLTDIKKCDTVDECFFGGLTDTFKRYPFNEDFCNNWHLYSAERCLHNRILKHSVYVCEIPLIHTSEGNINHEFNSKFRSLCKLYNKYYPEIYTTCARSKTNILSRNLYYIKMELKRILKDLGLYE